MRTKAFHAFEQKLIYFEDDIEIIDVIRKSIIDGLLTDNGSQYVLKNVNPTKHSHIARRKNSDGSRRLIIDHLRATLYSSYVKDVYAELTHYFKTILNKAAENRFDAGRIIGDHHFNVDAKSILELGTWENVAHLISNSVFQSLESEKSTLKLLKKIAKKLALKINDDLINNALPYLEIRHFLVHSDGKVTTEFKKKYPKIKTKSNKTIQLDEKFIRQMRDSVKDLVAAYDKEIISANLLKAEDTQP